MAHSENSVRYFEGIPKSGIQTVVQTGALRNDQSSWAVLRKLMESSPHVNNEFSDTQS